MRQRSAACSGTPATSILALKDIAPVYRRERIYYTYFWALCHWAGMHEGYSQGCTTGHASACASARAQARPRCTSFCGVENGAGVLRGGACGARLARSRVSARTALCSAACWAPMWRARRDACEGVGARPRAHCREAAGAVGGACPGPEGALGLRARATAAGARRSSAAQSALSVHLSLHSMPPEVDALRV